MREQVLFLLMLLMGLTCVMVSFVWMGCASRVGGEERIEAPPRSLETALRRNVPRIKQFRENIQFLREPRTTTAEVRENLGSPVWESRESRLMAYLSENYHALYIHYDTDGVIRGYTVKRYWVSQSLADEAIKWMERK